MMHSDPERVADRARLARELHDGIAQDLVGVGYSLDLLLANPEATMETRSQLRILRFTVTELIDKVRREIYFLRQPSYQSLSQSIKQVAQELLPELGLTLDIDEVPQILDSELSYEMQQIAQEIFRNITAHAQASNVMISLHGSKSEIELSISDDGVGGAAESPIRYGLKGIRDRTTALNGSLEIQSDATGTRVTLRMPLEKHANR